MVPNGLTMRQVPVHQPCFKCPLFVNRDRSVNRALSNPLMCVNRALSDPALTVLQVSLVR